MIESEEQPDAEETFYHIMRLMAHLPPMEMIYFMDIMSKKFCELCGEKKENCGCPKDMPIIDSDLVIKPPKDYHF